MQWKSVGGALKNEASRSRQVISHWINEISTCRGRKVFCSGSRGSDNNSTMNLRISFSFRFGKLELEIVAVKRECSRALIASAVRERIINIKITENNRNEIAKIMFRSASISGERNIKRDIAKIYWKPHRQNSFPRWYGKNENYKRQQTREEKTPRINVCEYHDTRDDWWWNLCNFFQFPSWNKFSALNWSWNFHHTVT